jgi:hypothetical protein
MWSTTKKEDNGPGITYKRNTGKNMRWGLTGLHRKEKIRSSLNGAMQVPSLMAGPSD